MKSIIVIVLAFIAMAPTAAQRRVERQVYIAKYMDWAVKEMFRTGIPASITLAQGILESDCGRSDLAVGANNHFGIKCHNDWDGKRMYKDDDRKNECFRSYETAYDSFRDHSDFLVNKNRYRPLFELDRTDYEGWAHGLKKCGYATEPTYAKRLITIIEEEGLSAIDRGETYLPDVNVSPEPIKPNQKKSDETDEPAVDVNTDGSKGGVTVKKKVRTPKVKANFEIEPFAPHKVEYNNNVRYVEVRSNDTFESIASEFQMMKWELFKYNDLESGADIGDMAILYLRPKRNRAHSDCKTHTVEKGETMWSISQRYGVKLRKLLRRNNMAANDVPIVGQLIHLR